MTNQQIVNEAAAKLEQLANQLEPAMAAARRARENLSAVMPAVVRFNELEGAVDALDDAAAAEFGFARLDDARRRLVAILSDGWDKPAS